MIARAVLAVALIGPVVVGAAPEAALADATPHIEKAWEGPESKHVWIDAQAGVEYINLQTFNADFDTVSVGLLPTAGVGPAVNIGAGLRFLCLTLGVRGRVASFQDSSPLHTVGAWQVWTLDGELGLRAPIGRFEPHAAIAAGYSSFGGFGDAIQGLSAGLDVHGVDGRIEGGADYWLTHDLSLGLDASAGLLGVARPGVSARDLATPMQVGTINEAKARVLEANGSSVGWMFAMTGDLGVHF